MWRARSWLAEAGADPTEPLERAARAANTSGHGACLRLANGWGARQQPYLRPADWDC